MTSTGISTSSTGIPVSFAGISASPTGISTRQFPPVDILALVQETPFTNSQYKEINELLKKGVFVVVIERDIL